jgi:hypothetical protein
LRARGTAVARKASDIAIIAISQTLCYRYIYD